MSKGKKQQIVAESVLKQLELRLGKETTDNPHFQSFVWALVKNEVRSHMPL